MYLDFYQSKLDTFNHILERYIYLCVQDNDSVEVILSFADYFIIPMHFLDLNLYHTFLQYGTACCRAGQ